MNTPDQRPSDASETPAASAASGATPPAPPTPAAAPATPAAPTLAQVRADLIAEQDALDAVVASLDDEHWSLATPSPRWSIADQIGHLTYFDGTAAMAVTDPDRFQAVVAELYAAMDPAGDDDAADDVTLADYRAMSPSELLHAWRANRGVLSEASAGLADGDRVIWYGPSMGAKSFLTARLMEAWAHGQDIMDALGQHGVDVPTRPATDRLQHIAQLGFITHKWSYINRGEDPPPVAVRVELTAPSGGAWTFGTDDADDVISGSAEDFCLVVTQRRHPTDTGLDIHGEAAAEWMTRAQAFAGPATDGPAPGGFATTTAD